MSSIEIQFIEGNELPEEGKRGVRATDWESALQPLQAKPDTWASVRSYKSDGGAGRTATALNKQLNAKGYQFTSRRSRDGNGELVKGSVLFARYVKPTK